jgi:hypothetical protein
MAEKAFMLVRTIHSCGTSRVIRMKHESIADNWELRPRLAA